MHRRTLSTDQIGDKIDISKQTRYTTRDISFILARLLGDSAVGINPIGWFPGPYPTPSAIPNSFSVRGVRVSKGTSAPFNTITIHAPIALAQAMPMDATPWGGLGASTQNTVVLAWGANETTGDLENKTIDVTPLPAAGKYRWDLIGGAVQIIDKPVEATAFYNEAAPATPISSDVSRERMAVIDWIHQRGTEENALPETIPVGFSSITNVLPLLVVGVDENGVIGSQIATLLHPDGYWQRKWRTLGPAGIALIDGTGGPATVPFDSRNILGLDLDPWESAIIVVNCTVQPVVSIGTGDPAIPALEVTGGGSFQGAVMAGHPLKVSLRDEDDLTYLHQVYPIMISTYASTPSIGVHMTTVVQGPIQKAFHLRVERVTGALAYNWTRAMFANYSPDIYPLPMPTGYGTVMAYIF